jgi:hypothetical protein
MCRSASAIKKELTRMLLFLCNATIKNAVDFDLAPGLRNRDLYKRYGLLLRGLELQASREGGRD